MGSGYVGRGSLGRARSRSRAHEGVGFYSSPDRGSAPLPGGLSRRDRCPRRTAPQRNGHGPEFLRVLLDEMYPAALAQDLRTAGIEAATAAEMGLAGRSDPDVLAVAVAEGYVLLTENVSDFARLAAEHLAAGRHHPGVLIALSSRFSRRPSGIRGITAAVSALADDQLEDRLVYLEQKLPPGD